MRVDELNREQLTALKQDYYCHVLHENDGVSYGELCFVNDLVTDREVMEYYADTEFSEEDF